MGWRVPRGAVSRAPLEPCGIARFRAGILDAFRKCQGMCVFRRVVWTGGASRALFRVTPTTMTTITKAGRYELRDELGRGAMGVVYRAMDPVIGREVAVKTMRLTEAGTGMTREELISRFQTEARAAGLLTHPNIVVVYDAGAEDGLFYITMELIEGRSLQSLMDAQQIFPLPRVMRLMEQACGALDFAHQRNVVHRDIKPANLMLTEDDTLKITDFGTAKILQFGTAQTAHVMGTPSYMSPEQVKGKPVDGRSDVFSLGVVLYELMTGEKPFPGQNITTVIYKIVNEDPIPPRSLDSSIHPGLSSVITRALAKEPAARYQNCRELLEALRNYRDVVGGEPTMHASAAGTGALREPTIRLTQQQASRATSAPPAGDRPMAAEEPRRVGIIAPQEAAPKKRGSVLLVLILLAIIGYSGYRVWPAMLDLWQREHESLKTPENSAPANPPESSPAAANPAPVTPPQSAPATKQPANNPPASSPAASSPSASSPAAPAENKPAPSIPEKPAPKPAAKSEGPAKSGETPATPETWALKTVIEKGLASAGLGDKVKVHAAGNTLTLTGRLNPAEHRVLLQRLHNLPNNVHVIDDIEYTSGITPDTGGPVPPDHPAAEAGRGHVDVTTDVLGATAILRNAQGAVVSQCATPCHFDNIEPASYSVQVSQAGYQTVQRPIELKAGELVDERIELPPTAVPTGTALASSVPVSTGVAVTSRPAGAGIFINGVRQEGQTPANVSLPPGTYQLAVRKPGFEPYLGKLEIKPGQPAQVDVDLALLPPGVGWVGVMSTPVGAEIFVDGTDTGKKTPSRIELPQGEHQIVLTLAGYADIHKTVQVRGRQGAQVKEALTPQ